MKTNLNQNSRLLEAKNPVHIEHLDKSELKPEAYLQNFGEYILEIGNASKYGDKANAGQGIQIHISDTRGRKRVTNNNGGSHAKGLCYPTGWASDSYRKIEIDRETSDTYDALAIVAHEVAHALCNEMEGHKGNFPKLVFDVFKLGGIATATEVTKEFKQLIERWLEQNGTYPHVAFTDKGKRQTTRMVKIACIDMGCDGATRASIKQGFGTIFRLSSAIVFKQADNLCCPVCMGEVSIESEVNLDIYK
jgi:hypothetical protein